MTKYEITGKTLNGSYINTPRQSCRPADCLASERIDIEIDGTIYNRRVYERVIWRNGGTRNTVIARFVIVNGTRYEIEEAGDESFDGKVLRGFKCAYDGYIVVDAVGSHQFDSIADADEYMAAHGLIVADEAHDYELREWPDGTWLLIRASEDEWL